MPNYEIWMLGASQITVTDSNGDPESLSGFTQGDGSHLLGGTIVLNSRNWEETRIRDRNDNNFDDNQSRQELRGRQTIDGVTYRNRTAVEAEYQLDVVDPDGNVYTVIGYNVNNSSPGYATIEGLSFVGPQGAFPPEGVELQVIAAREGPGSLGQPPIESDDIVFPVCFTPGTEILTPGGWKLIQQISVGDLVVTRDNGAKPVEWIGKTTVDKWRLEDEPQFRPIRVARDAFGACQPFRDMHVSPQHRFLLSGWRAEMLFGETEVFAPAIHLIDNKDIVVDETVSRVTYIHLMFDQHEVILADGMVTESFFPGTAALGALGTETLKELLELFPELGDNQNAEYGELARRGLRGWESGILAS